MGNTRATNAGPAKRRSPASIDNPPTATTPRDALREIEEAHRAAETDTSAGMARTAAARAARKLKSEQRRAEFLRGRGWKVTPPSGEGPPSGRELARMATALRAAGWTATPPTVGQLDGQADMLTDLAPVEESSADIVAGLEPDEAMVASALGTQREQAAADLATRIESSQAAAGVAPATVADPE